MTERPSIEPRPRRRGGWRAVALAAALATLVTAGSSSMIVIRKGDTLWDLARTHHTTVATLSSLNNLPGNGMIYAGETLRIPGSSGSSRNVGVYRVTSGDTLSGLAVRFGTTVSTIRSANRLSSNRIRIGQRLRIPDGGRHTATVPTTNAGYRIPQGVRASVAEHRRVLASRSHPVRSQVRAMVAATARRYGVSPSLAVAVAYHESGFQQRVVSPVDAIGVMQVLPSTGRVLSQQTGRHLDLLKTSDNITAGVLLLRQLQRAVGTSDRVLAGYYQGLGSLARQGVLPQTRAYIGNINALRGRFAGG